MIIQHLKSLFLKVEIHPITLFYFVFAWFGGYLKWYLSSLGIVCFHEICHLLMAYYFHFDIKKIEILPFGAYLSLGDFYFHDIIEEFVVVMAGPCSHLLMELFFKTFYHGIYLDYLLMMNHYVFFFNLLPIYPLDGGRMICLFLQSMMDLKKAFLFHLKISVLSLCVLTIFYIRLNTFVMICYLFVQQIFYYRFIYQYLRQYYSHIPTLKKERKTMIHDTLTYRRGYLNYYFIQGSLVHEKDMVYLLMRNVKN